MARLSEKTKKTLWDVLIIAIGLLFFGAIFFVGPFWLFGVGIGLIRLY